MNERSAIEEHFRAVVETAVDGIVTIDDDGRIRSFNRAAEGIFGHAAAEVLGQPIEMLMPEPFRGEHAGYMEAYRRTGVKHVIGVGREVLGLRKDGSTFPMDIAVGEFVCAGRHMYTGVVRDITERKQLEQALHERAAELELANQRKDDFVGMLGHELRNPLSAIRTSVELLRLSASDDPATAAPREIIARQTQHLARLVDDLLDMTRVRRGTLALRTERVELGRLVRHAHETVHAELAHRGQALRVHSSEAAIWLDADPTRIAQAVANLLHNASKFSPPGQPIDVTLAVESGAAVVRVRDHGAGIDPALLPQVFDLFVSGVRWVGGVQSGLGIGLQLVRQLVEMHGGHVEAHSEGPGRGSTFTVSLPVTRREAEPVANPDHGPAAVHQRGATPLAQTTHIDATARPHAAPAPPPAVEVLVVDDNVDAASSLAELLRLMGHEAVAAYSGRAGLQAALEHRPQLVLLDISLPDMDGYQIARRLRAEPSLAGTQLVALTGYGQPEDRQRSLDAGFAEHLTKPVSVEGLERLLASA